MVVGDVVVWWRAMALYPYNKVIKVAGVALVLSTLGMYTPILSFVTSNNSLSLSSSSRS